MKVIRRSLPTALVASLVVSTTNVTSAPSPLNVMSVNILEDNGTPSTNPNRWVYNAGPDRRDRLLQVVADFDPDLLGVQEALSNQVSDLTGSMALSDYGHYMVGVGDGVQAGANDGIFYRTARFQPTDSGVFWLSPTPDVPGSKHPSAARIRIATWMKLLELESGQTLFVISTHFDHASSTAREFSAQLVRERIDQLSGNLPVIVMGDLNLEPDERSYRILVGEEDLSGLQLLDSLREILPAETSNELTRHGFSGNTSGDRVDYILHDSSFQAATAAIVHTTYDGGSYPSDHYPVTATFNLLSLPAVPSHGTQLSTIASTGFEGAPGDMSYDAGVSSPDGMIGTVLAPVHSGTYALGFTQTLGGSKTFVAEFETIDLRSYAFAEFSLWWHAPDLTAFESSDYLKIRLDYRTAGGAFSRTLLNASVSRLEANDDWAMLSSFLPADVEEASIVIEASIAQVDREHLYFDDVLVSGQTVYSSWASTHGLGSGIPDGPFDDPDSDGCANLKEFAFDGDPLSGTETGKIRVAPVEIEGDKLFAITLPIRDGAVFEGATHQTASIDGIVCRIEGGSNLVTFDAVISEVQPAQQTGLPALANGWSYRTFRFPDPIGDGKRAFLRASVGLAP